jgi:hypothetical protein
MTQSFNNTTIANELYPVANAITSSNPFVVVFQTRDPTTSDIQYPIQKVWLNTATENFWFLQNFTTSAGVLSAHWVPYSGITTVETLTGNTGGAVPPTLNNINVVGDGTFITTVGNPGTSTLTIEPAGGLATIYTENTGTAVPSAGNLNVFGTGGITTTGSGNTITIDGSGVVTSNLKFNVDAHTAPGTNPVVPDGTGHVTITGGQVPAGTTANVIRTDSLAANTYTVEVQRSQAVVSSTIGDNGVSHFNSAQFTVDSNGFVSAKIGGAFTTKNQVFTTTGTYTPTTGMAWCQIEVVGGGGGGAGCPASVGISSPVGGGGGAGGYARKIVSAATIGVSQAVTIGAGGAGGAAGLNAGNSGTTTSVGAIVSATGGVGGSFGVINGNMF